LALKACSSEEISAHTAIAKYILRGLATMKCGDD